MMPTTRPTTSHYWPHLSAESQWCERCRRCKDIKKYFKITEENHESRY